jgi:hypothetical protein
MLERDAQSIVASVTALMSKLPARSATRSYAEKFSWDDTTQGQLQLFRRILRTAGSSAKESYQSA